MRPGPCRKRAADAGSPSVQTSTLNDQRLLPVAPRNHDQARVLLALLSRIVAVHSPADAEDCSRPVPAPLSVPSVFSFFFRFDCQPRGGALLRLASAVLLAQPELRYSFQLCLARLLPRKFFLQPAARSSLMARADGAWLGAPFDLCHRRGAE